jgi:uncharacterized protein YacL
MVLHILRALFVLLMAAAGWFFIEHPSTIPVRFAGWGMAISLSIGVIIVCIDILSPRRKLQILSGTILGLLVGLLLAYALSFAVQMIVEQFYIPDEGASPGALLSNEGMHWLITFIDLMIGITCCYLSISFILQSRNDFRFIIPYVEFSKQIKGSRPILLDTSILIDGRIVDIAATGIIESQLIVPRFVLDELHALADSADKLKRSRGRRGLDVLHKLRDSQSTDVAFYEDDAAEDRNHVTGVDQKLLSLAHSLSARIMTTDFNLNKVAQLRGVNVINLNDVGHALRPIVLPGERLSVRLVRAGEEPGQGVGYLEDGTMVVVEQGRDCLNTEVELTVTKLLQTSAGRMIFGHLSSESSPAAHRPTRNDPQSAPNS